MRVAPVSFAPRFGAYQVTQLWKHPDQSLLVPQDPGQGRPVLLIAGETPEEQRTISLLSPASGPSTEVAVGLAASGKKVRFFSVKPNGSDDSREITAKRIDAASAFEPLATGLKKQGVATFPNGVQTLLNDLLKLVFPEHEAPVLPGLD